MEPHRTHRFHSTHSEENKNNEVNQLEQVKAAQKIISKKYIDELTYEVIGAAIEVQKEMGRGLLENIYHKCFLEELYHRNIKFISELNIPVVYKRKTLTIGFRCDVLIEDCIVAELEAVPEIPPFIRSSAVNLHEITQSSQGPYYKL